MPVHPYYGGYGLPPRRNLPAAVSALGSFSCVFAAMAVIVNLLICFYITVFFIVASMRLPPSPGTAASTSTLTVSGNTYSDHSSAQSNVGFSSTLGISPSPNSASARGSATGTSPAAAPTQFATAATGSFPEYVAPDGLSTAERRAVLRGLLAIRPLTDSRKDQLLALLSDVGGKIVPQSGRLLTPEATRADVLSSSSDDSGAHADIFVFAAGRVRVGDASATFVPIGNQPIEPTSLEANGLFTDESGIAILSAIEVQAVADRIQNIIGVALNPAQMATLRQRLQTPGQIIITPAPAAACAASQVQSALVTGDSGVALTTAAGSWTLGPNGEFNPGIVRNSAALAFARNGGLRLKTSPAAYALVFSATALGLLTAVFLLITGILALRGADYAGRLFTIYALVRILLALIASVGWHEFIQLTSVSGHSAPPAVATTVACIAGGVAVVFPIIVLILLQTRSIREYFSTKATA
jgi:hypothetical protein